MPTPENAIVLNGAYGVGKSATLDHLGDLLAEAGRPFSLMDVDWFHRSWPPRTDDPDNVATEADNLSAVWANYRRAGPRQLVMAGVLVTSRDRERYERAFGLPIRSVRLEGGAATRVARLRGRYSADQESALRWHLDRHEKLASRLVEADLDEFVVHTEDRSARQVAEVVIDHFGLGARGRDV